MLQCTYYFLQDTIPNENLSTCRVSLEMDALVPLVYIFNTFIINHDPLIRNGNIRLGTYRTKVRVNIEAVDGT